MNKFLPAIRSVIFLLCMMFAGSSANASHLYGGDLYYKWISGNTYQVTLACYGDCSGGAFPSFHTSVAEIKIFKDTTLDTTIQMACLDTNGTEVTPVCPSDTGMTACHGGTLPGIKRFIFQGNVTLKGLSFDWVFVFDGNLTASTAGRSGSITNLSSAGTMILLDTLNNMNGPSSSAEFTTIPTPFFCINEQANFNPGAVDPDGDSLSFKLVRGIANFPPISYVTYAGGYTYNHPVAVAAPVSSNFSLDSSSGQLTFTPNIIQRSLVVLQINKYDEKGNLLGTSMREMTVVVIPCTTKPPTGIISNNNGGKILTGYDFTVCQSQGPFSFHIDPQSTDGTNVTATATGLPAGATYNVTGNGTKNPTGIFSWNADSAAPGVYKFFITYQNDACPLSSKQVLVYSVTVLPATKLYVKQIVVADCHQKGAIEVSASTEPWVEQVWNDKTLIDSISGLTVADTLIDSLVALPAGQKYTVIAYNKKGCPTDTSIAIAQIPNISDDIKIVKPSCYGLKDGSITLGGSGGAPPLKYHIDGYPDKSNGIYDSLATGTYNFVITDSIQCKRAETIVLEQPDSIHLELTTVPNACDGADDNGQATVIPFGGTSPYTYRWIIPEASTNATITAMQNGVYRIFVKDANGCIDSSLARIGYDDCCTPFVPNAFSPNGDGKNDKFRIRYNGDLKLINLSIYNRFGERVYFSIYPDEGWDGTFAGVPQDMGEYYYYIKAICGNKKDNTIELKGNFTLIR